MGVIDAGWYARQVATYGAWVAIERPTERAIVKRLRRDGIDCGRLRARRLREHCIGTPIPPRSRGPSILIVGDAHFEPGQDMRRATWLGRYIREHLGPEDHVVQMGDWFGNTSVCKHTKPREKEGLRLIDDLNAGNLAIELLEAELGARNTQPHKHALEGNHCARPRFFVEEHPQYEGMIGSHLMRWEPNGWAFASFLDPVRIEGWRFQHYLPNKMGRAWSGEYIGATLLKKTLFRESIVVGHGHEFHVHTAASPVGGRVYGMMAGCFFEHTEHYTSADVNRNWWRGLVRIDHAHEGDGTITQIRMSDLQAMYG